MTKERYQSIVESEDVELTEKEIALGWHFCNEYDGLLVGPEMYSCLECCHCWPEHHPIYKFRQKSTLEMVQEFHTKFVEEPKIPLDKVRDVRPRLIEEELIELDEAILMEDQVKILDALSDLQYVLDGTYIAFGLDHVKQAAFEEVHRSNMAKLGPDGKPIIRSDGKILKPEGWQPPNLKQFIS